MTGPVTNLIYRFNKLYLDASNLLIGPLFDPTRDIVLITGGGSGLGKEIAAKFKSTGATVIVFDIGVPEEDSENYVDGVIYLQCDVSNHDAIMAQAEFIKKNIGTVTLLINNAGITLGKTLMELSFEEIEKTLEVDLLSSFYTIKTFMPDMLEIKRGYIVTIASILGYLSPVRLSAYGASKAGLIALHESLTYELGPPALNSSGVKTLLLCPGQLQTRMFQGVKTPSSLIAPELDPKDVAKAVYKAVKYGKKGEIRMPLYGSLMPLIRMAPWPLAEVFRQLSGIDDSMKQFVGAAATKGDKTAAAISTAAASLNDLVQSKIGTPKD